MSKIVHSIIQRLITQEKALVIVKDNADYKERMLELHPNLYETAWKDIFWLGLTLEIKMDFLANNVVNVSGQIDSWSLKLFFKSKKD